MAMYCVNNRAGDYCHGGGARDVVGCVSLRVDRPCYFTGREDSRSEHPSLDSEALDCPTGCSEVRDR